MMKSDVASVEPCVLIVMGVSGSGKSTVGKKLAARLGWSYEEGDDFHPQSNVDKMHAGHPLTDEDRWPWLRAIATRIDEIRAAGQHAVITCSALKRSYRAVLTNGRPDVRVVYLKGDRDLIAKRLETRRGHFMPAELLESQFSALQPRYADEHAFVVSIDAKPDEIVDTIIAQLPQQTAARSSAGE